MTDGAADQKTFLVEEYKALRAEMAQTQQARMITLGITFTALGVLSGIVLTKDSRLDSDIVPGALIFGTLLIGSAVHFSTVLTQRIDRISEYITMRYRGELNMGWEIVFNAYRHRIGAARRHSLKRWLRPSVPLGTSKPFAVYYMTLIAANVATWLSVVSEPSELSVAVHTSSSMAAFYLALNLYFRFGWHLGWVALDEEYPRRRWPWTRSGVSDGSLVVSIAQSSDEGKPSTPPTT